VLACWLAGCDVGRELRLHAWTLEVDGQSSQTVHLPADLGAQMPRSDLHYRLRADVDLPSSSTGRKLRFALPSFEGRVALEVDGMQVPEHTTTWLEGYRRRAPLAWVIEPEATRDGHLAIALVVDHRWSHSAWFEVAPQLRDAADPDWMVIVADIANSWVSAAAMVVLLLISTAWLLVYFADRSRRGYLWFAILGINATVYPLFVLGATQHLFGAYDVLALHIGLAIAITASVEFTRSHLGLRTRSLPLWLACAAVSAMTILLPDPHTGNLISAPILTAYLTICLVYDIVIAARETLRRPGERRPRYILASWIGMVLLGIPDFVYWSGLGDMTDGARVGSLGLALVGFWTSMVMSADHVSSLSHGRDLNAQLVARVAELEARGRENAKLNRELQRQIAERSGHLAAALALVATGREEPLPKPGDVIHERYRVDREIGSGGMGKVYEVTRVEDGARFALKVATKVRGDALARLAREAQMAATAHHKNLVSIIDVNVAPSGVLYLVMELVEGHSLRSQTDRWGDKPWALDILRQLAHGLLGLHAVGIVHRDLKPSNVLISTDADGKACVKIVDFGIARLASDDSARSESDGAIAQSSEPSASTALLPAAPSDDPEAARETATVSGPAPLPPPPRGGDRLTGTGVIPGTPAYIAPELGRLPAELTPAADIYAFGVIAHEVLTGIRPFTRPQLAIVIAGLPPDPVPSVATHWRDAPEAIARVLKSCIDPDPDRRPSSADLVALLGG
jgi:hypothetical protein